MYLQENLLPKKVAEVRMEIDISSQTIACLIVFGRPSLAWIQYNTVTSHPSPQYQSYNRRVFSLLEKQTSLAHCAIGLPVMNS